MEVAMMEQSESDIMVRWNCWLLFLVI